MYLNKFKVIGISIGRDLEKAIDIINEFKPKMVVARSEQDKNYLLKLFDNEEITVEELAKIADTINYEIISTISFRVDRIYINE